MASANRYARISNASSTTRRLRGTASPVVDVLMVQQDKTGRTVAEPPVRDRVLTNESDAISQSLLFAVQERVHRRFLSHLIVVVRHVVHVTDLADAHNAAAKGKSRAHWKVSSAPDGGRANERRVEASTKLSILTDVYVRRPFVSLVQVFAVDAEADEDREPRTQGEKHVESSTHVHALAQIGEVLR